MSAEIRQIALRIRELRELSGLSTQEMAEKTGISKELYEKYEQGRFDMPISFLCAVSAAFNMEMAALVTGEDPKLKTYSLVRNGDGVEVDRYPDYHFRSLAYKMSNKVMEPFYVTCPVRDDDAPVSLVEHEGHEFNYVLEGSVKIILSDHEFILNEGDSLYFDSKYPHTVRSVGDKPAKYLAIVSVPEVL